MPTTIRQSSTNTTEVPSTTVNQCKNGGSSVGGKCICPTPYQGEYCESVSNSVPGNVIYVIRVTVEVENRNYSTELENRTSDEFRNFSKEFKQQMRLVYGHIDGYDTVEITMTSPGSIITSHKAIFNVEAQAFNENVVKTTEKYIEESLQDRNCTNENKSKSCSGLQLSPHYKNVSYSNSDVTVDCKVNVDDKFKDYYTAENISSGLVCLSRCHKESKDALHCIYGKCELSTKGPKCFCDTSKDYWYIGQNCQFQVHILTLILVTVAVALIIIIVLTVTIVCCTRYQHMNKQNSMLRKGDKQKVAWWEEDAWEWPYRGLTLGNPAAGNLHD
ncbi:mucin-17-like [Mustelus asterias]